MRHPLSFPQIHHPDNYAAEEIENQGHGSGGIFLQCSFVQEKGVWLLSGGFCISRLEVYNNHRAPACISLRSLPFESTIVFMESIVSPPAPPELEVGFELRLQLLQWECQSLIGRIPTSQDQPQPEWLPAKRQNDNN